MRMAKFTPRGEGWGVYNQGGTKDHWFYARSHLDVVADASSWIRDYTIYNSGAGALDIAWPNGTVTADLAYLSRGSAAGSNASMGVFASPIGVYLYHPDPNNGAASGKVLINNDAFGPYEKGASIGAWPLHSTADFSANNHTLTNNNSIVFSTGGPTGNYATLDSSASQWFSIADHADFSPTAGLTSSMWFYRNSEPTSHEYLMSHYNISSGTNSFIVRILSDDRVDFQIDVGGTSDLYSSTVAIGQWYHVAATYDGKNTKLYLNGELAATGTQSGSTENAAEVFAIGAVTNGGTPGNYFDGRIAGATFSGTAMTAEEIKGIWEAGQAMLQVGSDATAGLDAASVVAVDCIDEGWCASASVDSVQVWKYIAPMLVPWKRYLGPGAASITDVALWWDGGADSVALAIGTAADLQLIQPDPNIYAAATYQNPWVQPSAIEGGEVLVDSAGVKGVFWNVTTAIDAGVNAERRGIKVLTGTYPGAQLKHNRVHLRGVGRSSFLDGGITSHGLLVTADADSADISHLRAGTDIGGGTAWDAFNVAANATHINMHNLHCEGSDDDCFYFGLNTYWFILSDTQMRAADDDNVVISSSHHWVIANNTFQDDLLDCEAATSTAWSIVGNRFGGGVTLQSGCNSGIVDGNNIDGTLTDNGAGNTIGDNE